MSQMPEQSPKKVPNSSAGSWEKGFERFLWNSRFLVMLAVIPSLLGAIVLFIIGTMDCEDHDICVSVLSGGRTAKYP